MATSFYYIPGDKIPKQLVWTVEIRYEPIRYSPGMPLDKVLKSEANYARLTHRQPEDTRLGFAPLLPVDFIKVEAIVKMPLCLAPHVSSHIKVPYND
ncbi:MAG: hypothetical protein HXY36_06930 [Chloroflexi bacterium]|nr:hypothetical protein [Chloroflexota bacterium]